MNTADSTHGTTASDAAGTPGPTSGSQASSSAPSEAPVLTVRGLTKTYGSGETEVDAVRSVDLDVASGEVLLVMGPSGSGKTTLLLMLGALLRPTGGSITVTGRDRRGVDIAAAPEKQLPALRSHTFGFIFQDYALLDALTATENIAVAANLAGTTGSAAHHRATELLDRVGLAHRASARPSQMSGGEQQRVAVARALSNDPPFCSLTSQRPTSTPLAAGTSPGCCAGSPTKTTVRSSSSATTSGFARSRTACCGWRTGSSARSPPWPSTPSAGCQSSPPAPTSSGTVRRSGSAPRAANGSSPRTPPVSSPRHDPGWASPVRWPACGVSDSSSVATTVLPAFAKEPGVTVRMSGVLARGSSDCS